LHRISVQWLGMTVSTATALLGLAMTARTQTLRDLTPVDPAPGDTLVVGYLGGFERWNDGNRGVRQTVLHLRDLPGVHAESVENRHRRVGRDWILQALGRGARPARVILFGQSLGGAAAIATARDLRRHGIPVSLTVQVDSVGLRDGVIPDNVRAAANFYQHEWFTFQGETRIRAQDPTRTRILANEQIHYPALLPWPSPESWMRRTFGGGHARMEADPRVWLRVESLIRESLMGEAPEGAQ